jgi:radical SAM protein with 4Fe4S-binding SPASM domain
MSIKLRKVALHLTRVCSSSCPFCYLGDTDRDTHPPLEQIARVIRELGRQLIEELYFVGGDPCSYPHLLSALQLTTEVGIRSTVLSNTLDFGTSLNQAAQYIHSLETTIHGSSSFEHDQVVGIKGAYAALIGNIRRINSLGLSVGVMFNVTPSTFDKFFLAMYNLLRNLELDIAYAMIQRIIPRGRAEGTLKYSVSAPHVRGVFDDIERVSDELQLPVVFEDPFPLCIVEQRHHRFLSRCEWGFSKGAIDAEGNISRCGSDPRYQIGNIFRTDLQWLWENSPILKSFRTYKWLPERCQECALLRDCGGGCSLSRITELDHAPDVLLSDDSR